MRSESPLSGASTDTMDSLQSHEPAEIIKKKMEAKSSTIWGSVFLNRLLAIATSLAGLLDVLATTIPPRLSHFCGDYDDDDINQDIYSSMNRAMKTLIQPFPCPCVDWLDENNVSISFAFSILCFIDAFFYVNQKWNEIMEEREKKRFQEAQKRKKKKKKKKKLPQEKEPYWKSPRFYYYSSLFVQLLLLPMGFYVTVFYAICRLFAYMSFDVSFVDTDLVVNATNVAGNQVEELILRPGSKLALLFAILQRLVYVTVGTTALILKSNLISFLRTSIPKLIRRIMGRAIHNPFKFRMRLKKILTFIRWVRYILPLWGPLNKLKANIADFRKKLRQKRNAARMKKARKLLFENKGQFRTRVDSVIMIQKFYRSYKTRQATFALMLLLGNKKKVAAIKVQRMLRKKLHEARERLQKKEDELQRLEQKQKSRAVMSSGDKKRLYELQDEFGGKAAYYINRKLLLRPNTKFAVTWKVLFILCLALEVTTIAMKPFLKYYKDKTSKSPMSIEEFIAYNAVPTPISEWPTCQVTSPNRRGQSEPTQEASLPWYCEAPYSTIQEDTRDLLALALLPRHVSEWEACKVEPGETKSFIPWRRQKKKEEIPSSWYCEEPYDEMHKVYRYIVNFIIDQFVMFVSIICFCDVFVTFFTGDFDPKNGCLIPKPFVKRWITPGMLLQLAVNPKLSSVSPYVFKSVGYFIGLGPVRGYRWTKSVFFPLGYLSFRCFIEWIWTPAVRYQNTRRTIERSKAL